MSNPTETQRLMDIEIEKHTIVTTAEDTDRVVLDKIVVNLNGKTEAIAKLRRGDTNIMAEIKTIKPLVLDHAERFKRFDDLCHGLLYRVDKIWAEIKDIAWLGIKKAMVLMIVVLILHFVYIYLAIKFPELRLEKPIPSPSS